MMLPLIGPDMRHDLLMRNDAAGELGELHQHGIFLRRQVHFLARLEHGAGKQVDFHVPGPHQRHAAILGHAIAQRHAHAGQQFLRIERFGEVIVRPQVQRRHLLVGRVAGGHDDERRIGLLLEQRHQFQPVPVG